MRELLEAEKRVRELVMAQALTGDSKDAEMIAAEVAAGVYKYLLAVALSELAIQRAKV
ncbi:MAG: hypothetical protein RL563_2654 [Pseudomonadota bacterium]|jgi:hypothetical protein